mmetsp:Transcript_59716/g.98561  ORF Transcript_59716/g.98561 Transcript_59716/m.98561 type:complete len:354 (+) Transcript_59716:2943-4004(+)
MRIVGFQSNPTLDIVGARLQRRTSAPHILVLLKSGDFGQTCFVAIVGLTPFQRVRKRIFLANYVQIVKLHNLWLVTNHVSFQVTTHIAPLTILVDFRTFLICIDLVWFTWKPIAVVAVRCAIDPLLDLTPALCASCRRCLQTNPAFATELLTQLRHLIILVCVRNRDHAAIVILAKLLGLFKRIQLCLLADSIAAYHMLPFLMFTLAYAVHSTVRIRAWIAKHIQLFAHRFLAIESGNTVIPRLSRTDRVMPACERRMTVEIRLWRSTPSKSSKLRAHIVAVLTWHFDRFIAFDLALCEPRRLRPHQRCLGAVLIAIHNLEIKLVIDWRLISLWSGQSPDNRERIGVLVVVVF